MRVNHPLKTGAAVNEAGPLGAARAPDRVRATAHGPIKVVAAAPRPEARTATAGRAVCAAVRAGAVGLDRPTTVVVAVVGAPAAPAAGAGAAPRSPDDGQVI